MVAAQASRGRPLRGQHPPVRGAYPLARVITRRDDRRDGRDHALNGMPRRPGCFALRRWLPGNPAPSGGVVLGVPALGLGPMTGARVRRLAKGLSVLAVAGLLAAACGDDAGTSAEPAQATATTTTVPELPEIEDIESAGGEAIDARPFADWVTVAGDSAWVANVGAGVGRYDRATGELLESVPTQTGICLAMEQGFDSLWLGQCRSTSIMRVDLVTGEIIADIALPVGGLNDESSLAVTDDAVWALSADADRTLVGVDPQPTRSSRSGRSPWAPAGYGGSRDRCGSRCRQRAS